MRRKRPAVLIWPTSHAFGNEYIVENLLNLTPMPTRCTWPIWLLAHCGCSKVPVASIARTDMETRGPLLPSVLAAAAGKPSSPRTAGLLFAMRVGRWRGSPLSPHELRAVSCLAAVPHATVPHPGEAGRAAAPGRCEFWEGDRRGCTRQRKWQSRPTMARISNGEGVLT
jgi:hypothetical protein